MSRAVWIDARNDANAKVKALGAIPYFDARDPRLLSTAYLDNVRATFGGAGLFLCSQGEDGLGKWPSATTLTGVQWADQAYQLVQKVAGDRRWIKVCLNCEIHNPDWIVAMLRRWRSHSPLRETSWALEGHQGGMFSPDHVTAINRSNVLVLPEFFRGAMEPQSPGVVLELLRAGFNPNKLSGFYDAAALPYNWGVGDVAAFAFTQGRLP